MILTPARRRLRERARRFWRRGRYPDCMADQADAPAAPPEQAPEEYPPYVTSADERKRWDACVGVAKQLMGADAEGVWMATRSLYRSDIPT